MDDKNEFPKKWAKVLDKLPEFKDIADSSSTEELQKIITTCEGNIYTIEKDKSEDDKLNATRELMKTYSEPYRDAIKVQTAKIKYALYLLDGRGVNLNNKE